MTLDSAITRFQKRQEALFRDECSITRVSDEEPTFDDDSGDYESSEPDEIYEGLCQVRPAGGLVGTDVIAGEREIRLTDLVLKLPVDTPVEINDTVTVTDSTHDVSLIGRTYRITDVLRDGRQIARVCVMEEAT